MPRSGDPQVKRLLEIGIDFERAAPSPALSAAKVAARRTPRRSESALRLGDLPSHMSVQGKSGAVVASELSHDRQTVTRYRRATSIRKFVLWVSSTRSAPSECPETTIILVTT